MRFHSHVFVAFLFYFTLALAVLPALNIKLSFEQLAIGAAITFFFGLIPDVDSDISRVNQWFEITFLLGGLVLTTYNYFVLEDARIFFLGATLIAMVLLSKFLHHRGFLHSIRFGALVSLPLLLFSPVFFLFGFTAFFSHLVADKHVKL